MRVPTADERRQERGIAVALLIDVPIVILFILLGVLSGSLIIVAEALRGGLMMLTEFIGLYVMRRLHRDQLRKFEFGTLKLEHACNSGISVTLLFGALWLAYGAAETMSTGYSDGSPVGFALGAALGAVNVWINLSALVALTAAQSGVSVILSGHVRSRIVKLLSSLVVQVALTVTALTSDPVVAAWADGLGALFVSGVMAVSALQMLREATPHLLDTGAPPSLRQNVAAMVQDHAPAGFRVSGIRMRGTTQELFLEIGVTLAPTVDSEAVGPFVRRLSDALEARGTLADISLRILPQPAAPLAAEAKL
jgi:divalent metal cation (Fe/Co/Zn/Cd) transporter